MCLWPNSPGPLTDDWKVTDDSSVNFHDVFFYVCSYPLKGEKLTKSYIVQRVGTKSFITRCYSFEQTSIIVTDMTFDTDCLGYMCTCVASVECCRYCLRDRQTYWAKRTS